MSAWKISMLLPTVTDFCKDIQPKDSRLLLLEDLILLIISISGDLTWISLPLDSSRFYISMST